MGIDLISFFIYIQSDIFRLRECDENGGANYPVKNMEHIEVIRSVVDTVSNAMRDFQSHFKECEIETKDTISRSFYICAILFHRD